MTSIDGMGTPIPTSVGAHSTGWITSLLLHATVTIGAFVFTQQITLAPQPPPFKWNVAMVEPTLPTSNVSVSAAESTATPEKQPSTPVPHTSSPSLVRPNRPSSVKADRVTPIPPPTSSPSPTATSVAPPAVPVPVLTTAAAPSEPAAQERSTLRLIEPASQTVHAESAHASSSQLHELERETLPQAPEPAALAAPTPPFSYQSSVTEPTASTGSNASVKTEFASDQQLMAMAPAPSSSVARPDYTWLSDTILRRVEELKRYPSEARLDRAEGKVVLKAVIRGDGSVHDVEVYQSSGFRSLDHAAVELLKLAAPFQLPRPLGKSQMTVKIPMNYRLEQ